MSTRIDLKDADYHISAQDMVVILQALAEGPYKIVQPAMSNLEKQIQAHMSAAQTPP
jgi:hypothetical protein